METSVFHKWMRIVIHKTDNGSVFQRKRSQVIWDLSFESVMLSQRGHRVYDGDTHYTAGGSAPVMTTVPALERHRVKRVNFEEFTLQDWRAIKALIKDQFGPGVYGVVTPYFIYKVKSYAFHKRPPKRRHKFEWGPFQAQLRPLKIRIKG